MRNDPIPHLDQGTEFGLILQARPPRIVHGTVGLLVALLGAGFAWAALTRVDLVVRAPGRVRPVTAPRQVFNGGRGEVLSASAGGRVVEVNFREGDQVRQGDVLVRLETGRLDNEIARRRRTIQTGGEEVSNLGRLEEVLGRQFEAGKARAEAELAQATEEVRQAKKRQAADVRLAEVEMGLAQDEESRQRQLTARGTGTEADLVKATARLREAKEKLDKARLEVDEGRLEVLRKGLALASKDHELRREELAMRRAAKQGEVEAARLELANLELEREQAVLRAPADGVIVGGDVKVGDVLQSGKPVAEIAEQKGFRFEVAVRSEEVGHLRVGMPVRIKLDAYDYQKYGTMTGTVVFVSPDSTVPEGQQAIYVVRIEMDGEEIGRCDLHGRVKLGMSGQAEIVTEQENLLWLLVRQLRRSISLG